MAPLQNCIISFHTNDEDKDDKINVAVVVKDANNTVVAFSSNNYGRFNGQSDTGHMVYLS